MSASPKKPRKLLHQVLIRVLPIAVLVLFSVWYGAKSLIYDAVHNELIEKLEREADFGAETLAARLDTLIGGLRGVAENDLVVNSILDTSSRAAYIPTYMQSLRLPGPKRAKISLTDYRGRLIASNTTDIELSAFFLAQSSLKDHYMRLDETGATFAVPVMIDNRQEGAVVVRYNGIALQKLLSVSSRTEVAAVFHYGRMVQSSNWPVALDKLASANGETDDCVVRGSPLPGYPELRYVVAEPIGTALATANRIELIMFGALALVLFALVTGLVLTALLTTRPLVAFAREIKAIGDDGDLDRHVGSAGYAEFDHLSASFNQMLAHLRKVLVSHDALDRENQARKAAEQALRRSEKRYRSMVDASARGILICSADEVLFANQSGAHMLGYDAPEKLSGVAKVSDLFGKEFRNALKKQMLTLDEAAQQPLTLESRRRLEGGAERWFESVSVPTTWQGLEAVQVSLSDITERKQLERMKSEFVSIVSHELRTPLTSLSGSLGLIQSGTLGELPEQVQPLIAIAHRNTERLAALVNDILDVEKIEAGEMEFHMAPIELVDLCAEALTENAFYGAKYGVTFDFMPELHGAWVKGDRDRLLQILANLLSNAAKFSPQGSAVVLKISEPADGRLRVSVIDRGPGIPADKHDTVFEKFKQVDSSDSRAKEGTGLGLPICQSIAENHGTRIEIASVAGEGATFYFDMNRIEAPAQSANATAAATARRATG